MIVFTEACPLWFNYNSTTKTCQCGDSLGGVVMCNDNTKKVFLQFYYCMTYSVRLNTTVVGACLMKCWKMRRLAVCYALNELKSNSTEEINHEMCGDLNRQGQLCGSCREGYGLPAYFSSLICVNCSEPGSTRNMGEYLAITFVPLTILYFIMVAFKISVTSGYIVAYVLVCQVVTTPTLLRAITMGDHNHFLMSWFDIWNLNIFTSV